MSPNGNWFCARHPVDKQASNSSFGLRAKNLDVHEIYRASRSRLGLEDLKTFTPIGNQNLPKETSRMCLKFPTQVFVSGPVFKKGKEVKSLYRHLPTSVVSIVNFIDNLSFFWENKDCLEIEGFHQNRIKMKGLCTDMLYIVSDINLLQRKITDEKEKDTMDTRHMTPSTPVLSQLCYSGYLCQGLKSFLLKMC